MALNKQKGNMYGFVTHTWNPIKGRCSHGCKYCYMNSIWDRTNDQLRLDESELKVNLGSDKTIFIGSSTDMWANNVPDEWINKILDYIEKYPENTYLFQTKNPKRYQSFLKKANNENVIFGITLETTEENEFTGGQKIWDRFSWMAYNYDILRSFVTIEPIMKLNLEWMKVWLIDIDPEFVAIGANTNNKIKLPEPSKKEILQFIEDLEGFTKVYKKDNLKRLLK